MNRIVFSLAFVSAMVIMSCTSDDDDPSSALIGIWEISEFTAQCSMSIESFSENADGGCITIDSDQLCRSITFQKDGSGTFSTTIDGDD